MADVRDALGVATRVLTAQAFALDRLFFRAARESAASGLSRRQMSKALRAQARCRATIKILFDLRAAAMDPAKLSNLNGGTIQTLKTTCIVNGLLREGSSAPPQAPPPRKRIGLSRRWSPERRAMQAAAIREWQPWQKSTGPRTQEGKARSAKNALRHGHRSRAHIEMLREDRRILHLAADNIAIAKVSLRFLSTRTNVPPPLGGQSLPPTCSGVEAPARSKALRVGGFSHSSQFRRPISHRIGIGRARPSLVPFTSQILGESRSFGLPPADNATLWRRWRPTRHDEEDVLLEQG